MGEKIVPTKEEIDSQIMDLWDEIFELEDKLGEELDIKYAEWRKVEPLLDKGIDADEVVMHMESMKGISEESMLIYREVKTIKNKYKQEMDEKHAEIDTLNKEKK
ncbi:hypothetical protein [Methanosarcina sp.]|uniref:hypothetical protein n=1 Tax=Methanosarcina sp. TaxID=2213 RepID=UPI003C77DB9A